MSKFLDRVRGYIYPRTMIFRECGDIRVSSTIRGMLGVMLVILLFAHAVTLIAGG